NGHPISTLFITSWMPSGALEWTRTTTPILAQALNLLRIPFRHEGIRTDYAEYNTLARWLLSTVLVWLFLGSNDFQTVASLWFCTPVVYSIRWACQCNTAWSALRAIAC